jgi:hypothetical protein
LIEPTLKSTSVTVEARPTAPRFSLASRISAAPGARGRQQRSSARDVISCGTNLFFLYGFFAQYVLGVPAAVGNEIVVILEAL